MSPLEKISSVVDVGMREGSYDKVSGSASIGLLSSRIQLDGPIVKEKSSFNIGARVSYFDVLVMPVLEAVYDRPESLQPYANMNYYDINAKLVHRFSDRDKLSAVVYWGKDVNDSAPTGSLQIYSSDKESYHNIRNSKTENRWGNMVSSLFYTHRGNNGLTVNTNLGFSRYGYRLKIASDIIKDADVFLTVNGNYHGQMVYDEFTYTYKSSYVPKEGDKLCMRVETDSFPAAESEIHIPYGRKMQLVSWEKVYSSNKDRVVEDQMYDYMGQDTVVRITLRIMDPEVVQDYYRLKVRGYALSSYSDGSVAYIHNDIYTSADIIFKDEQLNKGYRGWPAYFSNVFPDQLFNGKEYEFTVESRLRKGDAGTNYIVVELQSITKELYYYLKSAMLYRITDQDAYTEPIMIYSNIDDGWGILGGVSSCRQDN